MTDLPPPLPVAALQLAGLWALAFVQPLFDILGKNAAFFVARDNTAGDILIFAFAFVLVPPLVLTLLVFLARLIARKAGAVVMLTLIALLVTALVMQILKGPLPEAGVLLPVSLALGAGAAALYARAVPARSIFTVLGAAPAVFLALFLLFSPVNELVTPHAEAKSGAGAAAATRPPIVVMVFDELPATSLMRPDRRLDAKRFPNFARMGREATWYRNAIGAADGTYVAVPAIFTGRQPQVELPTVRTYPHNLFRLLGRSYTQHAFEPLTRLCPVDLCGERDRPGQGARLSSLASDLRVVSERLLLPDDLASGLPPIDRDWEDFAAQEGDDGLAEDAQTSARGKRFSEAGVAGGDLVAERLRSGRAVVRTMEPSSKPGLWMVHYVMPHVPWRFLPDGRQYVVDGPTIPGLAGDQTWTANGFLRDQGFQRHLLQARFADKLLGEAISKMKATGLWDRALVIAVADHGVSVRPRIPRRPVTRENFSEIANVPLFVKMPGQRKGAVQDGPARVIDVVPTIVKRLGINTDWKFDGTPLDEPHPDKPLQMRNGRRAKLVSVSRAQFLRGQRAQLRRQSAVFPPGDEDALYEIGPRRDLVGRRVTSARSSGAASGRIDGATLYRKVNPATGVVPAYVTGELSGVAPGRTIAVAVNGTIRATGQTYSSGGGTRYSVIVRPSAFRNGANRVEVLGVGGSGFQRLAHTG
jgi:hypothetical protein